MNIRELPETEKPREKLLREGKEKLSNSEILAILLRSGTKQKSALEVAGEILAMDRRGIQFLADCRPEELSRVGGVGPAKACEILAAVELGKRIASVSKDYGPPVTCSSDIAELFMEKMRYLRKEHFYSILINAKGQIIEECTVSIGDLCSSTTHPREVFVDAVRRSAGSVIFVHNHPSGDPTPSQADIDTTRRLMEAGQLLGIPVLDHVIIGDGRFVSMKAQGLI